MLHFILCLIAAEELRNEWIGDVISQPQQVCLDGLISEMWKSGP